MDVIKAGNLFLPKTIQIPDILRNARRLGLNAINVPVLIEFIDENDSSPKVNADSKKTAIELIREMNNVGLKTILEPYPLVNGGAGSETGIQPSDTIQFFTNWKRILAELAGDVAIPYRVYAMNTSSNLVLLEQYSDDWISVFSHLRGLYIGMITYRTNWWVTAVWDTGPGSTTEAYQKKLNNPLFGSPNLDFISISAYFELDERARPSVSDLVADLSSTKVYDRQQDVFSEIKAFYDKWGKPIFFGELGASSYEYAAFQPWNERPSEVVSEAAQANLFLAYKEKFSPYRVGGGV